MIIVNAKFYIKADKKIQFLEEIKNLISASKQESYRLMFGINLVSTLKILRFLKLFPNNRKGKMHFSIRRINFKTTDKEDAIAEVVRVYLDYYELDNRSRTRIERIYREMLEQVLSERQIFSYVSYGGVRLEVSKV
ncbi:hypothetical protein [Lactococcus cremoris]|uniref:Uncharacterized protein n=1 Tax=Lactococcus cremoris subsp. tructae TaxID=542833 RepID=A0A2A5SS58_LACLC|nr:hypothetical protein [Lactococcus cremoris]PCS17758.1 hypothetical protein RU92_GL002442 [Lactococcus cremoris subsp. tructae]